VSARGTLGARGPAEWAGNGATPASAAGGTVTAVHPSALPNRLAPDRLRLRPAADGVSVAVNPRRAGWRYLSFRIVSLPAGAALEVGRCGYETAIVTIAGGGCRVDPATGGSLVLPGRASVWDGAAWVAYLPPEAGALVVARPTGEGPVVLAIAEAPGSGRPSVVKRPIVVRPEDVAVEVRGRGNATRQINHLVAPDTPADRLLLVEVYTPSGNWSSWPPHKHDTDDMPREAVLEEVYYYQFRRPGAWGIQCLYRRSGELGGPRNALWAVRHGELVLVTDGYHPFVATHGDDAYYLNALAGDRRTMACSFDPDLDWVRSAWEELEPDPRLPLVPAVPLGRPPGD
jgi:5-deoxy-glucuronate isomerase